MGSVEQISGLLQENQVAHDGLIEQIANDGTFNSDYGEMNVGEPQGAFVLDDILETDSSENDSAIKIAAEGNKEKDKADNVLAS